MTFSLHLCHILPSGHPDVYLVGGLEHGKYFPFHIWDVILPKLTNSYFSEGFCSKLPILPKLTNIFQRGFAQNYQSFQNWQIFFRGVLLKTTNQVLMFKNILQENSHGFRWMFHEGSFMGQQHLHASILSLDAFTGEKKWSASVSESHGAPALARYGAPWSCWINGHSRILKWRVHVSMIYITRIHWNPRILKFPWTRII